MRYYLLHPDNTWSDLAEYKGMPKPRGEGVWVEGYPNHLSHRSDVSLEDKLQHIYDSQDVRLPCDKYIHIRESILRELHARHVDTAKAIIKGIDLPTELEPMRQKLITTIEVYENNRNE